MDARIYNCKDEELPVIGGYVLFGLKRDWADFTERFPKIFHTEYIAELEQKIDTVRNVLNPQEETVEMKNITQRLYASMDSLQEPAKRLAGYIKFTKGAAPVSVKDFGLTALTQRARAKDVEGVLKNLRTVTSNLQKYRAALVEQGLTDDIIQLFAAVQAPIEADNQRQFEILNKRKTIVRDNVNLLNDLYANIVEVCKIGKNLYGGKDALKAQDYTFAALKKKVRTVANPDRKAKEEKAE